MEAKEEQTGLDQVDIKGGESHPDIVERVREILNRRESAMAEDKPKTIRCPRCNYERAEIHNLIIAGTVRKIGETIICPKCQKKEDTQ